MYLLTLAGHAPLIGATLTLASIPASALINAIIIVM
ncbi:Uncharacterised protein [Mycobacteroides abscessus subsp. abscessus]|nr:Uncharacterised protein [Mycobacteroides abscessus subsp. abscessus]